MKHVAFLRRIAALSAITAITACGGGGSHSTIPGTTTPAGGSGGSSAAPTSKVVSTLLPSKAFTSSSTLIGPATTINTVVMHVMPNLQNAAGLIAYAQQASQPGNGNYRHFLQPTDIANRFGATSADYAAVATYFASYGLKVGGWPQRLALTIAGPRTSFEKALGTTLSFYHNTNGHTMLAPTGNVVFSKPIPIWSIADAVVDSKSHFINAVRSIGGPTQALLSGSAPQQIATAFDFTSAWNAGYTGKGITIGIIGTGGAMNADLAAFKAQYNLSGASTITFPPVSAAAAGNAGGSPTASPPPVTAPCGTSSNPNYDPSESPTPGCNPEDYEAQIDTEQAALARDASIEFYLAYVPVECNTPGAANCTPDPNTGLGYAYQGVAETDDEVQQIIADNTADIVSGSFGEPELFTGTGYLANADGSYDPNGLGPTEYAALAAEGIATFISSGDQGAQTCAPDTIQFGGIECVSYPAADTSVTAVGGLTVPVSNAGTLLGPITGWGQQTYSSSGLGGASGGGVSCYVPLPSWQVQSSYYSSIALLSVAGSSGCAVAGTPGGGRLLPDVSLEGDPATGVAVVANVAFGGQQEVFGGTSVAAPETAAMWALVLQACAQTSSCAIASGAKPYRLGNAAPLFWTNIYQNESLYTSTIYDITFGNNGLTPCGVEGGCGGPATPAPGYSAGNGWDAVTGLGAPFARHLITAVVGV